MATSTLSINPDLRTMGKPMFTKKTIGNFLMPQASILDDDLEGIRALFFAKLFC